MIDTPSDKNMDEGEQVADMFESGLSSADLDSLADVPADAPAPKPVTEAPKVPETATEPTPAAPEPAAQADESDTDDDELDDEPAPVKQPEPHSAKPVQIPPEITSKSAEELAQDISDTVKDAKSIRAKEAEVDKEMRKLAGKKHRLERQLEGDKAKIGLEAEQAKRLVEDDNS